MTKPSALRLVLVVAALTLGGAAQILVGGGNFRWAITPYLVAIAAMVLAVANRPLSSFIPSIDKRIMRLEGHDIGMERTVGIGGFALSLLMLIESLRRFAAGPPNTWAWYLYGASMILLLVVMPTIEGRWTSLARRIRSRARLTLEIQSVLQWSVLAAILILALFVRLYGLRELPPGLWHDEADNLLRAASIQQDLGSAPVFAATVPTLYLLPVAVMTGLLGITPEAIRLVSVAFSLAGIVAVFLLARLLMGPFLGLVAAFILAVMRWDINFGRIGMHPITMSLTTALAAYLTLRALNSRRLSDFGYAGAALGFGMWLYASFLLFPLVIGLILLHYLIFQRPEIKRFLLQVFVMGAVMLLIAAPVLQFALIESDIFFDRSRTTSVFRLMPFGDAVGQIRSSLGKHALMFNYEGDPNPRHNLPHAPMLDFLSRILLVLGLGVVLMRWRSVTLIALPFWIFLMALPGVLTVPWEAPQALRSIGVVPAVVLTITLALGVVWHAGRASPWPIVRGGTPFALAGLLGVIAFLNINTYFGEQASDPEVYASFTTDGTLIGRHMLRQQSRGYSLYASRQFKFSISIDLAANKPRYEVIRVPTDIPIDATRIGNGVSIYLEPREGSVFRLLKAYYPDARFEEVRPPGGGDVMYYSAVISREQLEARQGLRAQYTLLDGTVRNAIKTSTEASWLLESKPEEAPFDLVWEGALHIASPGEYLLALEEGTDAEVWMDARRILWSGQTSVRIEPAVGLHSFEVRGRVEDRASVLRLLWQPPDGQLEPIPAANLYNGSVRPLGLTGRFYESGVEDGLFDASRITPAMDAFWYDPVVPEPYFAVWEGALDVLVGGDHRFEVRGFGAVKLFIDGDLLAQHPPAESAPSNARLSIDAGKHQIRVEYSSPSPPSEFEVLWAPPGRPLEPLPIEQLSPALEHTFAFVGGE